MTCLRVTCVCCSKRREADEIHQAQLTSLRRALFALCGVIRRTAGWLEGEDKRALSEARALLAEGEGE